MTSRFERTVGYTLLIVFSILSIGPIVGIVLQAFSEGRVGDTWTLSNLSSAWETGQFSTTMRDSAIVAIGVTLLCGTLSVVAGYAFGCIRFRGSNALFYLILLGIVVPLEPVLISLYYNLKDASLIDTYQGLIIAEAMLYFPFGVFWMRAFFKAVPRSLLDAARIDGASEFRILRTVLLPVAKPAILTLAVLLFVWSWNEFLLPLVMAAGGVVTTAPVNVGLFTGQHLADVPGQAAAAAILSIPILLLYVVLQRHFIRGVLAGSVKG
jgi:raffinose/stachyose/melibiose transport system permease protein